MIALTRVYDCAARGQDVACLELHRGASRAVVVDVPGPVAQGRGARALKIMPHPSMLCTRIHAFVSESGPNVYGSAVDDTLTLDEDRE